MRLAFRVTGAARRSVHGIIFIGMRGTGLTTADEARLRAAVTRRMACCSGLRAHCERCLRTQRWGGSTVLMLVDAAFMSIGLNYFTAVVPAVAAYEERMTSGRAPHTLARLSEVTYEEVAPLWKNRRSWDLVRGVAACLTRENVDDVSALRAWAARAPLEAWRSDPVGAVRGVGINTYQYLRMMGGVDTSMPDKIVRRVIAQVVNEAGIGLPTAGDLELIDTIDRIGWSTGWRPIELCWMTWMIQSEGKTMRMEKYRDLLQRI
jgi:hypothetical protein